MIDHFGNLQVLANTYDTPLVIYSEREILSSVARLKSGLPHSAQIAYSIKANPNPGLLRLVYRQGLMAEAASEAELALALRHGVEPKHLILGGPAKRPTALELALTTGTYLITAESATDLQRISEVATRCGTTANVILRVNPNSLSSRSVLRMGGTATQFGIDEMELPGVMSSLSDSQCQYRGLFMYAGSQCFEANHIVENTRYLCRLAQNLVEMGYPYPAVMDFGGGFGVPEDHSQPALDLVLLRDGLEAIFRDDLDPLRSSHPIATIFESGRYLVSTGGVLVTRVMDVKRSHGRLFAILDAGINNLGIRQLPYRTFEPFVSVLGKEERPGDESVTLAGPTCTTIDIVHRGIPLSNISVDDLVIVSNFGAYSLSYSPIFFCGHPYPAEVLVDMDGAAHLLRPRGSIEEACGHSGVGVDYP